MWTWTRKGCLKAWLMDPSFTEGLPQCSVYISHITDQEETGKAATRSQLDNLIGETGDVLAHPIVEGLNFAEHGSGCVMKGCHTGSSADGWLGGACSFGGGCGTVSACVAVDGGQLDCNRINSFKMNSHHTSLSEDAGTSAVSGMVADTYTIAASAGLSAPVGTRSEERRGGKEGFD